MTFYAAPDLIDQIEYAKENAVKMLDYMEQYFNIPYPLPKAGKISDSTYVVSLMTERWFTQSIPSYCMIQSNKARDTRSVKAISQVMRFILKG